MKWLILERILNAKTIIPLLERISHSNLNTFNHENNGTLITSNSNASGIKTLSVLENVSKSRRKRFTREQELMPGFSG
jgi:aspartokinase